MIQNSGTPNLRNFPLLCAPSRLAVNSPHPGNHDTHKIKKAISQHPLVSETTQIHPDKIRAYLATDYRLGHTDNDIILKIGKRSERLAVLFASGGVDCGAFITAYNPRGTTQSDEANNQAHAQLAREIEKLGLASIEGSGSEEGTDWPAECSYFVLGLALEPAKAIGSHFDQDAIVWVGSDCLPQLILLR